MNANVAPMVEEIDIQMVPYSRPKMAPPIRVKKTAPGIDKAVNTMYILQ